MLASSDVGQEQHTYLQKAKNCSPAHFGLESLEENVSLISLFIDPRNTAKKKSDGGVATNPRALTSQGLRGVAKSHAVCPLQRELRSGQVIKTVIYLFFLSLV